MEVAMAPLDVSQVDKIVKKAEIHGDIVYLESKVQAKSTDEVRILAALLQRRLGDASVITLIARNGDYLFPGILLGQRLKGVYNAGEVHVAMAEALRTVADKNPEAIGDEIYDMACLACFAAVREKIFGPADRVLN
jgi:hypothetical protein